MDEKELTMEEMPGTPDFDPEEWEKKRQEEHEAMLAPFREAARQRQDAAEIAAEHDEMLSDMLYEMTMTELGEEV